MIALTIILISSTQAQGETMRMFRKEKLGRDKIIQRMEDMGAKVHWRYLDDQDYDLALRTKLLEEGNEVKVAKSRAELVEELADIYEVIDAMKAYHSLTEEEIIAAQTKKREERGGFFERKYVEKVAYPEGSYWKNIVWPILKNILRLWKSRNHENPKTIHP